MACTDCKQSIFDDTPSQIPAPLCVDGCPEDVNCGDLAIASKCVYVNVALPCSETVVNQDLTTVLQTMDAKICTSTESNCLLKVDTDDQCCGTLNGKLAVGEGLTKTVTTDRNFCKTLTLNLDCPTWNTAVLNQKWANLGGVHQPLEYSSVVGCVVKIRGTLKNTLYSTSATTIFTLPANHRPLKQRTVGGYAMPTTASNTPKFGFFTIKTTGEVQFTFYDLTNNVSIGLLPVELTFETN